MSATGHTMVALACEQTVPSNVVVHNGVVYWTNYAVDTGGGAIMSVPTTGGVPKVVQAMHEDLGRPVTADAREIM